VAAADPIDKTGRALVLQSFDQRADKIQILLWKIIKGREGHPLHANRGTGTDHRRGRHQLETRPRQGRQSTRRGGVLHLPGPRPRQRTGAHAGEESRPQAGERRHIQGSGGVQGNDRRREARGGAPRQEARAGERRVRAPDIVEPEEHICHETPGVAGSDGYAEGSRRALPGGVDQGIEQPRERRTAVDIRGVPPLFAEDVPGDGRGGSRGRGGRERRSRQARDVLARGGVGQV